MYSILREINKYMEKKGIPFKGVTFSYDYLDPYLDQAIKNKLNSISEDRYNTGCQEYTLKYDENNNLCLIAKKYKGNTILVIYDSDKTKRVALPGKFHAIAEKDIIKEAAMLKYLEQDRLLIRNRLYEINPNIGLIDRVKKENELIKDLANILFKELKEERDKAIDKTEYKDLLTIIIEKTNYNNLLTKETEEIINYIDYLFKDYLYSLDYIKKQEEEHKRMDGICYREPDSESVPRKKPDKITYDYTSREKKYQIIPFAERNAVLEKYPYVFRDYAYTSDKKEISYMNYLYNIGNNKYILIMEPQNGTKYTKIAVIESNNITREEFINKIRYYLQLSYVEGLEERTLVRSNHTTIETFKKNMEYIILDANNGLGNEYFKKRIRGLKDN